MAGMHPLKIEHRSDGVVAQRAGNALQRFAALLGDVFFVPCEWGTKKPLVTCVERPFELTKTPEHTLIISFLRADLFCAANTEQVFARVNVHPATCDRRRAVCHLTQ